MDNKKKISPAAKDVSPIKSPPPGRIRVACQVQDYLELDELTPLQGELKTLSEQGHKQLRSEILTTGIAFPIKVWKDKKTNWIIGGHQTRLVLLQLRLDGYQISKIPVVFLICKDIEEARRRVLQDIAVYGEINDKGLYQFMVDGNLSFPQLVSGFRLPEIDLSVFRREFFPDIKHVEFDANLDETGKGGAADPYTKKTQAPIYEPKGEKPPITKLFDRSKSDLLLKEIEKSKLPEEVKDFLRHAAGRHTVFDYGQIAEYYAHATKELQALMEKSALVIIDLDKAIENGFVVLCAELAQGYKDNAKE